MFGVGFWLVLDFFFFLSSPFLCFSGFFLRAGGADFLFFVGVGKGVQISFKFEVWRA